MLSEREELFDMHRRTPYYKIISGKNEQNKLYFRFSCYNQQYCELPLNSYEIISVYGNVQFRKTR